MPIGARPADKTIKTMLKTMTHKEIATHYGVSRQAVGLWAKSVGMGNIRPAVYKEILPWQMQADDHRDSIARALRWHLKMERGEEVSAAQERETRKLVDYLAEHDLVVDYDYDTGFALRPRDAELDAPGDLIRRPKQPA